MCFTKRQEMKTLTALSEEERIALYLQFL
jgi:hypothetical protein